MDARTPAFFSKTIWPEPLKQSKDEQNERDITTVQVQQYQQTQQPQQQEQRPSPAQLSSSLLVFHQSKDFFSLKTEVGADNNPLGSDEASEAGCCVCLPEPTPPPPAGGTFFEPSAPLQECEPRKENEMKNVELWGSSDRERETTNTGAVSFSSSGSGRAKLNLRRQAPPHSQGLLEKNVTGSKNETGNANKVRKSTSFYFISAHTGKMAEKEQTLSLTNKNDALNYEKTLPMSPCPLGAPTENTKERQGSARHEDMSAASLSQQQQQQQQQPLLPGSLWPANASNTEEVAPPLKRLRNSTEWGELMSPTPTPQGLYSCGCTPSVRRHSKTGVPLPSGPTPVDFSSVTDYLDTKYEMGTKVSEGTYGEVYLGRDRQTGATVALKRLKVLQGLDGFPITSLREVIALRHIGKTRQRAANSPAGKNSEGDLIEEVISLSDVLLSRNHRDIFLVFPYASCSIAGLLQQRFPFSEREIAYVFKKILTALMKLHSMGIIHRDVKADNVLINRDGQVQLGDFGMCVFEGSGRRAFTPSLINLSYRPPEMLLGNNSYDVKVDIWSFGCFLAHMYLRSPPFFLANRQIAGGNSNADARRQHKTLHRRAETEMEQLSLITDVLGPLSSAGPDAFPQERCKHFAHLQQLRKSLTATTASSWSSFTPSLNSLFQPSFLYQEFHGFAGWFKATAEHRRRDSMHLLPSKECVDVLAAIFQLDPRRRPTAAQLLTMPFFDLNRGLPLRCAATPHHAGREELLKEEEMAERQIRREIALKMVRYHNSHVAPPMGGAQ